ncbi:MAG: DUF1836 domain-containing protein [Mogibacterium kristiansenii]|uniref:DUF1836 domain-containing protein n=1 Tax=Mogibacterium kristiansenii TaxID=2606708 RepID=UPI0025914FE3|nr:DUF1836 domain-containing protein [uncultured Mogibacterium sp.]
MTQKENEKNKSIQADIQRTLDSLHLPEYKEIPDVGLYLEQVTRFINTALESFPDMSVTPSMISNYVKLKVVTRPEKKAYSRDQIVALLFVAVAKTVLSMDNIRKAFEIRRQNSDVETGYEYFRRSLEHALTSFGKDPLPWNPEEIPQDVSEEALNVVDYTASAIAYKMYLNLYFDAIKEPGTSK